MGGDGQGHGEKTCPCSYYNIYEMETRGMVKKNKVLWCGVFSLCFLGGCGNKEVAESSINVEEKHKESMGEAFPEHINCILSSGVEVDAAIDMPELDTKEVSICQGATLKIDAKKISDVLLGDSVTEYSEKNGQGQETGVLYTYSGKDGSEITSINDTWVKFSSAKFADIRTDFETEEVSDGHLEFAFASERKADLKIREMLEMLGIEIYSEYEWISMDYETLRAKNLEQYAGLEEVEEFQEDMNRLTAISWSEDYNCYCFTYYGSVDGFKLNAQDRETNNNVVPGSVIRAVYSKDGIQSLEISNIYTKQKEIEKKMLCTMDTVLSRLDQKYNSIILQGNYKVTSMELVYMADVQDNNGEYILRPVWRCNVQHEYDTQDKNSSEIVNIEDYATILIDAISGTEIYSGGSI